MDENTAVRREAFEALEMIKKRTGRQNEDRGETPKRNV